MEGGSFFGIEALCSCGVRGHQLDHLPLGQIGGLVEDKAAIVDVGAKRLHRLQV